MEISWFKTSYLTPTDMVAKLALEARMDAIRTPAKIEIFGLVNYPDSNALLDKI